MTQRVLTSVLDVACEISGPPDALTVVLLHGFPYDQHCYDEVVPILNAAGLRTVVPCLRGHGDTHFFSAETPRSGQQAAIGHDLIELLDALQLPRAVVAGFDWGGRAACVAAALRPERIHGLVTCCGYQIQDIAGSAVPTDPEQEQRFWYQYYFHTQRGRNALATRRAELCRLLWKLWSPTWKFDDATWQRSAPSLDNPDFVDVVVHSYRHRMGNAAGEARYAATEALLAKLLGLLLELLQSLLDYILKVRQLMNLVPTWKLAFYMARLMDLKEHRQFQEAMHYCLLALKTGAL